MSAEPPGEGSLGGEGLGGTFCVKCGRESETLIGALCVRCYSDRTPLASLPKYHDVVICPTCGAREVRNHWEKVRHRDPQALGKSDVEPLVVVTEPARLVGLRWTESGQNPKLRQIDAVATVRVEGKEVEVPLRSEFHLLYHSCPDCSRRGGNYFTARIQLRSAEEGIPQTPREFKPWALEVWASHLRACSEAQREAVTREEELKEGWDIFFSDTAAAKAVARSFSTRTSAESRSSATLWGKKGGQEIYRVTFLVRLPPVVAGDLLEEGAPDEGGKLWEVLSLKDRGAVELQDVQHGDHRTAGPKDLEKMRFVAGREAVQTLPLLRPPGGGWFIRAPSTGRSLPLVGVLPPEAPPAGHPKGPAAAEPQTVVVGKQRAWWAPHVSAAKGSRARDSRG